jgi:uncharacterized protein (TIGR02145 family)
MKKLFFLLLNFVFIISLMLSCEKDKRIEKGNNAYEAYPDIDGEIFDFVNNGDTISCEKINSEYIFQGDIILTEDQLNAFIGAKGGGLSSLARRWPNDTVYYVINKDFPDKSIVTDAINHYESKTVIRFVERTNQPNYVEFISSKDINCSWLGMSGIKQKIKIAENQIFATGATIHEIGHTIGLIHEHSRKDRDQSVKIIWENIKLLELHNFRVIKNTFNTSSFDFESIMLYESDAFSKNPYSTDPKKRLTITTLDGDEYSSNYEELSNGDIEMINLLYSGSAPNASFAASKTNISSGETIQFTDQSTSMPNYWLWKFGDGTTSTDQNPLHIYTSSGSFTVSLRVTNSFDSDYEIKRNYITVNAGSGIIFNPNLTYGSVADIDGNVYKTIQIGTQTWMAENLKTTRYRNGELIGTTTPSSFDLINELTPYYQWAYNGDEGNVPTYGRLYTWFAANDNRSVCPMGWHIPSDDEWTTLSDYLINNGYGYGGSGSDIGKALAAQSDWGNYTVPGTIANDKASNNTSGFTALPGGYRHTQGTFFYKGSNGYWWSSTSYQNNKYAYIRDMSSHFNNFTNYYYQKREGFSVRCLKD